MIRIAVYVAALWLLLFWARRFLHRISEQARRRRNGILGPSQYVTRAQYDEMAKSCGASWEYMRDAYCVVPDDSPLVGVHVQY